MNPFDSLTYSFELTDDGTDLLFSDGSRWSYGGAVSTLEGWRYGLRNPDGSMGPDGPMIDTLRFKAWFAQNGWAWDTQLDTVQVPKVLEAPAVPIVADPTSEAPPPVAPAVRIIPPAVTPPHLGLVAELRGFAHKVVAESVSDFHALVSRVERLFHRSRS